MVVVLTSADDKTAYREEVKHLAMGCADNNLSLNTQRTKKLIVVDQEEPTSMGY